MPQLLAELREHNLEREADGHEFVEPQSILPIVRGRWNETKLPRPSGCRKSTVDSCLTECTCENFVKKNVANALESLSKHPCPCNGHSLCSFYLRSPYPWMCKNGTAVETSMQCGVGDPPKIVASPDNALTSKLLLSRRCRQHRWRSCPPQLPQTGFGVSHSA